MTHRTQKYQAVTAKRSQLTQINTREKARLKDRAFSFAQKEDLTMPETILSESFCQG